MPAFVAVGPFDALVPGTGTAVMGGRDWVALFRVDDAVYATEAWCLRCGAAISDGYLHGREVACRRCDWHYDVATGCVLGLPALRLQMFEARVIDGQIMVADA
jgi:nitrite reductase/ring-hydroxylating ferredoxin subunit